MPSNTLDAAVSAREDRMLAFVVDFLLLSVATAFVWFGFSIIRILVGVGSAFGVAALSEPGSTAASSMGSAAASAGLLLAGYGIALVQWLVIGVVLVAYFTLLLERDGQTLGMDMVDVTVVSEDGTACTRSQALRRTAVLLAPLPVMALSSVFIPLVGFPLALFMMVGWLAVEAGVLLTDEQAQRLGDQFADTVVVKST